MLTITEHDLADLATGAAVLGTGGGGDPRIGASIARAAIREFGPVDVVSLDEADPGSYVVPVAMMGAPTVIKEKPPNGQEFQAVLAQLRSVLDGPVGYIGCLEAGGLNSMIPIAAAAMTGLPLVDSDGMGRAFPELQMTLASLAGVPATPMAIADVRGNAETITSDDAATNLEAERIARAKTIDMGGWSFIALYPMRGARLAGTQVPETLTWARNIGAALRDSRTTNFDPVAAVLHALSVDAKRLFTGKIVDVYRRDDGGFARGAAVVTGLDADSGSELVLHFQNEHLLALRDGIEVGMVPDLISVLESSTGRPVTTESMTYGLRVSVIGTPCDPAWRTAAGLAVAGPAAYGYGDLRYTPVEKLACKQIPAPRGCLNQRAS